MTCVITSNNFNKRNLYLENRIKPLHGFCLDVFFFQQSKHTTTTTVPHLLNFQLRKPLRAHSLTSNKKHACSVFFWLKEEQFVGQFMAWRLVEWLTHQECQFVGVLARCWYTNGSLKGKGITIISIILVALGRFFWHITPLPLSIPCPPPLPGASLYNALKFLPSCTFTVDYERSLSNQG